MEQLDSATSKAHAATAASAASHYYFNVSPGVDQPLCHLSEHRLCHFEQRRSMLHAVIQFSMSEMLLTQSACGMNVPERRWREECFEGFHDCASPHAARTRARATSFCFNTSTRSFSIFQLPLAFNMHMAYGVRSAILKCIWCWDLIPWLARLERVGRSDRPPLCFETPKVWRT